MEVPFEPEEEKEERRPRREAKLKFAENMEKCKKQENDRKLKEFYKEGSSVISKEQEERMLKRAQKLSEKEFKRKQQPPQEKRERQIEVSDRPPREKSRKKVKFEGTVINLRDSKGRFIGVKRISPKSGRSKDSTNDSESNRSPDGHDSDSESSSDEEPIIPDPADRPYKYSGGELAKEKRNTRST